jgi:hypothetical protein
MPVEHIWDQVQKKHFDNHIPYSLNAVESTLSEALRELDCDPQRLRSLTFFPDLRITA